MSQHDTLTLREALRSIQYEAASLADAQVIALQALNATYPARAALSATQPAQAEQCRTCNGRGLIGGHTQDGSGYGEPCPDCNSEQPAQAAQSAPVGYAGYTLVQGFTAAFFPAEKIPEGTPLYIAPQPAAGADVLDAERYRWLRAQDNEDFAFAVVKNPHFDVYESPEELDAAIDAAIAASGRQE